MSNENQNVGKKPFYKKKWFFVLIAIVVIAIIVSTNKGDKKESAGDAPKTTAVDATSTEQGNNGEEKAEEKEITYTAVTADKLIDDLNNNAMKAEKDYQDQYLEITGKISTIDSDGKYIAIEGTNGEITFVSITCNLQTDEQRNFVMNSSKGATVVIKGKVTSIGEVLGYDIDIDEIKAK